MTQRLLSGDQSICWDAALKLWLLSKIGYHILHRVHTADIFSRPPQNCSKATVTRESCSLDGNVRRWTATLEAATFLGRVPLSLQSLRKHGVDFNAIARDRSWRIPTTVDDVVTAFTQSDWLGVSIPYGEHVAHGIPMQQLNGVWQRFQGQLRKDYKHSLGESSLSTFDMFLPGALPAKNGEVWGQIAPKRLSAILKHLGVSNISLTTSVDMFTPKRATGPKSFLPIFVHHYEKARDAYNQAASHGSESIVQLEEGQLPYYAVIDSNGVLVRHDLAWQPGQDISDVLRTAQEHGSVVAVLGKAMMLHLDLRLDGPVVLPELGSPYTAQADTLAATIRTLVGDGPTLHSVWRLKVNALDALKSISAKLHLPPFLRQAFGNQEEINAHDLGKTWRDAVLRAKDAIADLEQLPNGGDGLIQYLVAHDILGPKLNEYAASLIGLTMEFSRRMEEASYLEPSCAHKVQNGIRSQYDASGIKQMVSRLYDMVAARVAERIRDNLYVAQSLTYWNCRPFSSWVFGVPGWSDAILQNAKVEIEKPHLPGAP